MRAKKIGIVGCGAIGSRLAQAIVGDFKEKAKLIALYDTVLDKAYKLASHLKINKNSIALSIEALISKANFVIEAASCAVSADIARKCITAKRDCMIMSVAGLLEALDLLGLAESQGTSLYIPSGAICGIDGLKAHKLSGIKKVTLTTRKPPKALVGAPYILKRKINLDNLSGETEVFEGSASDAVLFFPQNINVAATLSLAGIGQDKTRVKIICSPEYTANTHEIEIESEAGKTFIRCENNPSPDNPKTSYLAILSAVATLKQILEPIKIGT